MKKTIYLDYNASTPVCKQAVDIMYKYISDYYGNPSSSHYYGIKVKNALEEARQQVANLVNANPDEIIFTSGGTESNNMAIKGYVLANKHKGNKIIVSKIEHPAVIEVCKYLSKNGFEICYIDVDENCMLDIEMLKNNLSDDTILVSIMHANNETGAIQNISEISNIVHSKNIVFHCDAAQSIGKIPVDVKNMGIDMLSIAGHKLYAPKGIGALYLKRGIKLEKFMHGAAHESNLRAGTENIPEITALGMACKVATNRLNTDMHEYNEKRKQLYKNFCDSGLNIKLNGKFNNCLPNTLNISFIGVKASELLANLTGIAASAGAACHSGGVNISSVLSAMGLNMQQALGAVRLSIGRQTTYEEIDDASKQIIDYIKNENQDKSNYISQTNGLGCACKLPDDYLQSILKNIPISVDENILSSIKGNEDAAVYKIDDDNAIVVSVDYFTPIVNNPYNFGKIAAANALSDIYAMGAKPIFALSIVNFNTNINKDYLQNILKGAVSVCNNAQICILGGHSINDKTVKFGLVAIGTVNPQKIWKNSGLNVGDALIITKPIGSGILTNALAKKQLDKNQEEELINSLSQLNKTSYEILKNYKLSAVTDVTGFGLGGHLNEMLKNSKVGAKINFNKIPLFKDVYKYAKMGFITGATKQNLAYLQHKIKTVLPYEYQAIFADAQTSGGLLVGVNNAIANNVVNALKQKNINAKIIGKVINSQIIELI